MNNLEQAKEILKNSESTCVLFKDGVTHTSTKRGVAPLVDWLINGIDIRGFSVADKIVGKAAALLFVLGGVKEVYTPVISKSAVDVLSRHGIYAEYDTVVQKIINRASTGTCPMELAVANINDPNDALKAIQYTMTLLMSKERVNIV